MVLIDDACYCFCQMRCRLKRAKDFIQIVTGCNYKFFRNKRQRAVANSIRAGVSPDLTVAYVDILFEEGTESPERPLNHIGQPHFPITLRICGLGTYFCPWYVDTNDVLMHAISQSHEIGVFIDKAWVNFIVDLNNHLRTVRIHHIHRDLPRLLQFLNDEKQVGGLGGIVVHFCTFLNTLRAAKLALEDQATSPAVSADHTLELPESRPDELTEFSTATQPLPGTFMGFFENRRNSGDSVINKSASNGEDSAAQSSGGAAGERFTFGRNSMIQKKNYFSDMFGYDEEHGKASSRRRTSSHPSVTDMQESFKDSMDSFSDVCDAVSSGLRLPGIVIFHESTPLEEIVSEGLVDVLLGSNGKRKRGDGKEDDRNSLISVDLAGNARDAYGERAEELAKFYKIVRTADKTQEEASSVAEAVSKQHPDEMLSVLREESLVDPAPASESSSRPTSERISRSTSQRRHGALNRGEEDVVSVEMVSPGGSRSSTPDETKDTRPFSPGGEHAMGTDEYILSSGHLYPVALWKWSEVAGKAQRITREMDVKDAPDISSSQLRTVLHMVGVTLGLQEAFKDTRAHRPVYFGMDDSKAHRVRLMEILINCVTFASRMTCNGSNKKPLSLNYSRVAGLVLFILNVADIAMSIFISINVWCIWGDSTECNDHSGFILGMVVWPGALICAPLFGLYATILTPTGRFARQYSCWSRLACFSIGTLFVVYLSFVNHAPIETLWYLLGLTTSRIIQIALVDLYIASNEDRRISRGWDGLFTNLKDEFYFE
jgi:hypothetical protein